MRILILIIVSFLSLQAFSQTGYKIDFKVKNWKDTTVYLGYYIGEGTFIKDTAKVNAQGEFSFSNKKPLEQGFYFLVKKNNKLFDFVVGSDQVFSFEASPDDFIKTMVVKGDDDNKVFFDYLVYSGERRKEADPFIKALKDSSLKADQKKTAREGYSKVSEKVIAYQKEIITKHPQYVTARWLKSNMPIDIPDAPKRANGTIDSTFQLRYYRQHFFDNFDLSDVAMLHLPTPAYQDKIKEYLTKLYAPIPDTVTKAAFGMIEKAKKNQSTYQFIIRNCLVNYQMPEIMGMDEVYVNLYDKYVATGEMDFWIDAKTKENLKEYADKVRSSMIGRTGANLMMQDQNLQPKSMYDIKAKYTILFFYNPDCGHCREETPKLVEFYNKSKAKYNFEIFAVSSDTSMKKMKDFIKEFKTPWITVNGPRSYIKEHYQKLYHADTTPTLYVLDDKKKIIAKKLPIEKLDEFLSKHEEFEKKKKTTSKGT